MRIDIEHGIANRIYRAFASFLPLKRRNDESLTLETIARRYGRGNVKFQLGLVMSDEEYEDQKRKVLSYDFM